MTGRRQWGTGSLRETSPGVWKATVDFNTDPLTGKRRQRSRVVHGNKKAAQTVLDELRGESPRVTTNATVAQLVAAWWPTTTLAPSTMANWQPIVERYIVTDLGEVKLKDLTAPTVVQWQRALAARNVSPHTVARAHMILGRVLSHAQALGWVTTNAARLARRPKVKTTRRRPPGSEVGRTLLDAAAAMEDPTVAVWLRVALVTGARRNEVLALRWDDFDAVERTLMIARSITAVSTKQTPGRRPGRKTPNGEARTGLIVEGPTKAHTEEAIALGDATVGDLLAHRGRIEQLARSVGVELVDNGFIFAGSVDGSRPLRPEWATRMFHTVCGSAGIDGLRLHDLRHRAAAVSMAAGMSAQATAGHLRHAKPSMTLDRYGGHIDDEARRVADALERSLEA